MKALITFSFFILSLLSIAQNNGYSLEFEDTFFLSVEDNDVPVGYSNYVPYPGGYTVPSGCVLKITAGCLTGYFGYSTNSSVQTILQINDGNGIYELTDILTNYTPGSSPVEWQPIWVSSGSNIKLHYGNMNTGTGQSCQCGFVSGVIFRKVAN